MIFRLAVLSALLPAVQALGNSRDHAALEASPAPFSRRSSATEAGPPSVAAAAKDSYRDESIPLLEASADDEDERMLKSGCQGSSFRMDITTDNYGFETSWVLEQRVAGVEWREIGAGPPAGTNYASNNRYVGLFCLAPGEYRWSIFDRFKDGLCCSYGEGNYAGFLDGDEIFASPARDAAWPRRRHRFTISAPDSPPPTNKPTPRPTSPPPTRKPTPAPTSSAPTKKPVLLIQPKTAATCETNQRKAKVEIMTDKYGGDTTWLVREAATGTVVVESDETYSDRQLYKTELCLDDGASYDFVIRDSNGDGMCCSYGQGYFKVFIDKAGSWSEVISGGAFKKTELTATINLDDQTLNMSDRDRDWLESHNSRRKEWHERYGKSFVPLEWSNSLKESAQVWAEKLLESCGNGLYHDPDNTYGENLAGNSGSGSWGAVRTTDKILSRWVENEADDEYPKNGHLTQALWRATKYVGCAEASKPKEGGKGMCHVQACRYARPGNCNMGKWNDGSSEWWLEPMMMDDSPCGPSCPPDGCY